MGPNHRLSAPLTRALVAAYLEYALTHLRRVPRPRYPFAEWVRRLAPGPFSIGLGDSAFVSIVLGERSCVSS